MSGIQSPPPNAIPCLRHPRKETRLRCTECNVPICPQCMVMYEVGFKCPGCAKKRPSHAQQVDARHYLIGVAGGLITGNAYGWLFPRLSATTASFQFLGVPVLNWLLSYSLGQLAGRLIQQLLRFKHQTILTGFVLCFAMAGLALSPFLQALQGAWELIWSAINTSGETSVELFLLGPGLNLLSAVFFLRGMLQPLKSP
jgi:hypothetical protein